MNGENPWANIFTLGGVWILQRPVTLGPAADKCLAVFTTPGAARLYADSIGLHDDEPKLVENLTQLHSVYLACMARGYSHLLIDAGTDRARTTPIAAAEGFIRTAIEERRKRS